MVLIDKLYPRTLAAIQPRSFDINPALNPWILFLGAVIAAIAVLYLYTAQRKIAGRGVVYSLMAIRTVLVLLVIALLLGPVRQWAHTRHSSGTLYVLLDQSQSMRQKDTQASDAELIAWANSLGYLPAELRPALVTSNLNRLISLRQDLDYFRAKSQHLSADADNAVQRQTLAAQLDQWQKDLGDCATELNTDPQVKRLASDVPGSLRLSAETISKNLALIRSPGSVARAPWVWTKIIGAVICLIALVFFAVRRRQFVSQKLVHAVPSLCMALALLAIALGGWAAIQWPEAREIAAQSGRSSDIRILSDKADIPWQSMQDSLGKAITQILPIATTADKDFLGRHGSDARVRDAMGKVKAMTRAELAFACLTGDSKRSLKSLAEMMGRQDVRLVPFGDHNSISSPGKDDLLPAIRTALANEAGKNTDIASALKYVAEQAGEDSSVLIVSDGRQNIGSEPETPAQFLASRGTRVFTLLLGSHQLARDAAVDHVDAPDWVYADDEVIISPVIKLDGLRGQNVTVQLKRDNQIVDTRQLLAKTDQEKIRLRLTDHPPREGVFDYSVEIPPVPNEAVLDNNRQAVRVTVSKQRLNILLVEDDPGWEYQFLRNYLARDHRVKLQVVLLNPAHIENVEPPQGVAASPTQEEGKIDAQVLPPTQEKWAGFDVVILGDIPPEKLPTELQKNLLAALNEGSVKALLLLAGQRNMPMRYAATPLADAIPVALSGSRWTPEQLTDELRHGFVPVLASEGLNSVLGQFSEDFGTNAALWANMPLWFWHSEQTAAKPAASVIWSLQDALLAKASAVTDAPKDPTDEYETTRQHALLATMNFGLGRVMYLASPQTWRLRYVQTPGNDSHIEDVHRRFWGQVVRWAVGNDLPAGGKFVRFGTNKHSYIGGESIVITARELKEDLSPMATDSFKMIATTVDGSQAGEATMVPAPSEGAGIYRGSMTLPAGKYTLNVRGGEAERLLNGDTTVDAAQKTLAVEVESNATVEDRDVNADPQTMAAIARAGAGVAMDGAYFDVLASRLPVVDRDQTQIVQAGLFSDPNDSRTKVVHWAFFTLFILLLTTEWILRKRGGLV